MAYNNADDPNYDPNLDANYNAIPGNVSTDTTTPATPNIAGNNSGSTPAPNTPTEAGPPNALTVNANNVSNPTLPAGTDYKSTDQVVKEGETLDPNKYALGQQAPVQAGQAAAVEKKPAATYQAEMLGPAPTVDTAQGQVSQQSQVQAAQQQGLSQELKSTLDTFNSELDAIGLDPNETMQGQYAKLMDFGPGTIPAWAKGAYTVANQKMAARGLDAGTIGAEAVTTALMQAALPIAAADSQALQTLKLTKLDKKAQGVFLRAGFISQLDMNNLNNRQQAAVTNAQSFLAMDLKNLDARQQSAVINTQARLQKMLSDQAAVNAAKQFNATSENQTEQFYADLGSRIDTFNVSQKNDLAKFNEAMTNDRAKFETSNAILIDQSNVNYLRNINTQNTAATNNENMVRSQNLLGISNTAMANQLQLIRDTAAFSFQSGENALDRAQQTAMLQLQNTQWYGRYSTQQKSAFWQSLGGFVSGAAGSAFDQWAKNDFSTTWLD